MSAAHGAEWGAGDRWTGFGKRTAATWLLLLGLVIGGGIVMPIVALVKGELLSATLPPAALLLYWLLARLALKRW